MASLIDDIAQQIRFVDGGNYLSPRALGVKVATFLTLRSGDYFDKAIPIVEFVERTNPDKQMGAGRLAELIVAEFGLDKED